LGAAILAGVGSRLLDSVHQACDSIIERDRFYEPDPNNRVIYKRQYTIYRELYDRLKPLFKKSSILSVAEAQPSS
jgi:xylulokinase